MTKTASNAPNTIKMRLSMAIRLLVGSTQTEHSIDGDSPTPSDSGRATLAKLVGHSEADNCTRLNYGYNLPEKVGSMMARPIGWAAAYLVLSIAAAGHAQNAIPPTSSQFSKVIQAKQHRDAVLGAAKQSTAWIKRNCQNASFVPLSTIKTWKPLEFDSTDAPIAGVWGETIEARGCGAPIKLNVMTVVREPNVLVSGVLAPGDTQADPTLQKDASRYVFIAALAKAPGCQQAHIEDTKVVRKEAPDDARLTGPVLVENWTVIACGRNVIVEVKFLPTANGTTIGAHVL